MVSSAVAEKEIWKCKRKNINIADIIFSINKKEQEKIWSLIGVVDDLKSLESGEEHYLNVLDRKNFFNFESYIKALKLLTQRNKKIGHKPIGNEPKVVQGKKYNSKFSLENLAKETNVNCELIKYHSPWVMVVAGLYFDIETPNAEKDFKKLLQYFTELKIGFSVEWFVDKPRAYLLDKVFEVGYGDENHIFIRGMDHGPEKFLKKSSSYYHQSNIWRGKITDFSNFVYTVENALKSINGKPLLLHGNGATWYGLDMMFYQTGGAHSHQQVLPQEIIGRIKVIPTEEGKKIETRIYSGKEVDLDIEVVKD